ncbi:MAG: DNA alkylation repair protein [Gammaproteobacteria bacterium]|nr:DNA alkylation repair protein [Gammaproteobacteria bacterium]
MVQARESTVGEIRKQLKALANKQDAEHQARYFKTGPGEYGEGDRFIGVRVPVLRKLARQHASLPIIHNLQLLQSRIHEHRLLALLILIQQFQQGDESLQKKIYRTYLKHTNVINNWDLVDVSADKIVGAWLYHHPQDIAVLEKLARSRDLWRRRISMMATLYFIRQGQYDLTLELATLLLTDKQDLIHKASGWMIREVGKRDRKRAEDFLDRHIARMPRTMLRYAIEKFPSSLRQAYLKK